MPVIHGDDPGTLVSTEWLASHLGDPDIRILDGTFHLPFAGRSAPQEYEHAHIPGAVWFDIDAICDRQNPLPHMAPSPEVFASMVRMLGVGDGHQVVAYDCVGLFSAARVWWMFRLMGHRKVAVLDGGLPKWVAEGRPLSDSPPVLPTAKQLTCRFQNHLLDDSRSVEEAAASGRSEIVDARASQRFRGEVAEPRGHLRPGHIPGSCSVPFQSLLNPDATMKSNGEIREILDAASVDLSKPVITTCGSGVTAAIINLALERLGKRDHSLYDGSWAEWGALPDVKVATGPA